ncbi:TetR/AcrR family transcriptional regulator [Secundilactobacillus kimchicus]|uniref:Transcription regulator n=1 Tax=Secundilactobacillus kimchicus JCM 15530 TaxID=1302272 RepID=A0A0R1HWC3_9LACO|nr:TetR/AcrR family transcriptional regulator [Secundilactobacillus kimchicus]KRK48867.1 transcription regulator [Secundilactobacillus kimchicus JCM 15530]MBT9671925.1 TetR family transcriptional regulator [Secundilactobacillus kimchicus]
MSPQEVKLVKLKQLHTATLELLAQKPKNNITISELCRKARVSRTYFYRRYQTIEDVLLQYQEMEMMIYLRKIPNTDRLSFSFLMTAYFGLVETMASETLLLHRVGLDDVILGSFNTVHAYLNAHQKIRNRSSNRVKNRYFRTFMAGGVVSVAIEWLESGMPNTPAQMGQVMATLFAIED